MVDSFHNYERKLERRKESILRSDFTPANKRAILHFADYCFSQGLSVPRVEKYVGHLKRLAHLFRKDFTWATKPDIEQLVTVIERSSYAEWTKHDLRLTIKKFYRWLRGTVRDPPETAWIQLRCRNCKRKLPEELLTEEDISKLISACHNARDKALVSVLYESGCRIGEIASLRMKHVVPHPHGFQMLVSGKNGPRRVLVVSSAQYLIDWLNAHPQKSDPQAFLWVSQDRRKARLGYGRIAAILTGAGLRAGITKRTNPHTFRHSRATRLANHLTEAQMDEFFGWVQGSDMPSVYVHLSGRDVDNALLETYGIAPDTKQSMQSKLKPRVCPRCSVQNAPTNKFCNRCGIVLDEETANELMKRDMKCSRGNAYMDALLQDEEFVNVLKKKLRELVASGWQCEQAVSQKPDAQPAMSLNAGSSGAG